MNYFFTDPEFSSLHSAFFKPIQTSDTHLTHSISLTHYFSLPQLPPFTNVLQTLRKLKKNQNEITQTNQDEAVIQINQEKKVNKNNKEEFHSNPCKKRKVECDNQVSQEQNLSILCLYLDAQREKEQQVEKERDSKEFYCQECQKQYKNKKTFNSHIQTQHNLTRPFKCNTCSHSFKRPDYLQKHLDSHKQERNFPCQSCEKKFKSKQTLEKHVKTVHKRVICEYCRCCNKGFTRKDYLKKHLQRGEQRYVCRACEKRFASKQSMERHFITKHVQ